MAMMHIREERQHQHSRRAGEYGRGAPLIRATAAGLYPPGTHDSHS
jgi:hypothetical protein